MAYSESAGWREVQAQALLRKLLAQTSPYGVVLLDLQGQITGWSHGASALTGYLADEVVGNHFALLFTAEDTQRHLPEHEMNTARTFGTAEDERWHMRKDGSRFWASGMTFVLAIDGEPDICAKVF
ncbi:MAG TPA: PAS domain S-box protein, partial [Roseateles sp.]